MPNKFKMIANTAIGKTKEYSPQILVAVGIGTGIAAGITACMSTRKIDEILEPAKNDIEKIKKVHRGDLRTEVEYTDSDYKKDLTITYVQTGLKLAKLYAPSVIFAAASITSILAGFNILNKRYSNMTVAYAGIASAYDKYRDRVKKELGEEMDRRFLLDEREEEVEEITVDKDGKEKKKKVKKVVPHEFGPFAKVFDCGSCTFANNPELDINFLKLQRAALNRRLQSNGFVSAKEAWDALGIEYDRSELPILQRAGWVFDLDDPNAIQEVSFGLDDIMDGRKNPYKDQETGRAISEPSYIISLNCMSDATGYIEQQANKGNYKLMDNWCNRK